MWLLQGSVMPALDALIGGLAVGQQRSQRSSETWALAFLEKAHTSICKRKKKVVYRLNPFTSRLSSPCSLGLHVEISTPARTPQRICQEVLVLATGSVKGPCPDTIGAVWGCNARPSLGTHQTMGAFEGGYNHRANFIYHFTRHYRLQKWKEFMAKH